MRAAWDAGVGDNHPDGVHKGEDVRGEVCVVGGLGQDGVHGRPVAAAHAVARGGLQGPHAVKDTLGRHV